MADQKISLLNELTEPLSGDMLPIVNNGETKKVSVSNLLSVSIYEEVTHSELYSLLTGATLTPGKHYLITDFKTCYDQPDYDYNGSTIETGNYKQGNVAPILVLATDVDKISEHAYQPEYSGDTIQYDPYFTSTEVTSGAAFGRITYRIDDKGNAFDYDFREVLFKRYDAYCAEEIYDGKVSIDMFGVVIGVGTNFTNRNVGEVIGIVNPNMAYGVYFYQIVSIDAETSMTVTGRTIYSFDNTFYTDNVTESGMSYKRSNIISNTGFTEYKTFDDYTDGCFNNTCGNRVANTIDNGDTFLLSNNVFRSSPYRDNSFGSNFRNNTFNDDCTNNTISGNFYGNVIDDNFEYNTISSDFYDNIIICNFQNNIIQNSSFYNNNLGDIDGGDFDNNLIMGSFYGNFYTGDDDFTNNILKSSFHNNIIQTRFGDNVVGNFNGNLVFDEFDNNTVGDNFYTNNIYNSFNNNTIGFDFHNNTLGTINNSSTFEDNHIGNDFKANLIVGQFDDNKIGNDFGGNEIEFYFLNNNIGNTFQSNDIGLNFQNNFILNNFFDNAITDDFRYNQIGNYFQNNNVGEGFGFGGSDSRGNVIGNYFDDNTIGEYFYNNNIGDNFENNTVGNSFQFNRIETPVSSTDFTAYLGNPIDYSYPSTTGTDGVYTGVTGTSSGAGVNSVFTITVASTLVSNVETSTIGKLYLTGDTITIASGSFNGTTDLVLTVDTIGATPMVYEYYNKTIQRRFDGTPILTALDNSGQWYVSSAITEAID
jgi:hypothetical protein